MKTAKSYTYFIAFKSEYDKECTTTHCVNDGVKSSHLQIDIKFLYILFLFIPLTISKAGTNFNLLKGHVFFSRIHRFSL